MKFRLINITNGKSTILHFSAKNLPAALAHKKLAALDLTLVQECSDHAFLDDRMHERVVFGRPFPLQTYKLEAY